MTASTGDEGGQRAASPHPIVAAIAAQRRRQGRTFRLVFVVTWMLIIGGAIGALIAAGKIDYAFMGEWTPYIIGGITTTIYVALISITFAIGFAIFGALAA